MQYDDTETTDDSGMVQERADARLKVNMLFLKWLKEAVDERNLSGIEEEWQLAEDLYAGIEPDSTTTEPQAKQRSVKGKSRIIINITESKTDTAASQVIRRVLPSDMRPWEIKPTPVPEFDAAIAGGSDETVLLADGSPAKASDVATAVKEMLKTKAGRMADQIQDWLTDSTIYRGATVYAELRQMLEDGARVGTGVIKGPFPTMIEERRWKVINGVATLEVSKKLVPKYAAKKARNCYPDPSCGDNIHNGRFFIERDYLVETQVRELADQPGYEPEELATVLREGPQSWTRFDDRYKDERAGQTRISGRETFETFYLYASISPRQLIGCGYRVPALTEAPGLEGDEAAKQVASQIMAALELSSIPIVATMINGRIVKVVLNPSEKGGFPYRFWRWAKVDGRPWGKGVPIQMSAPQLLLTAAVRAMSENAGQSAGPQRVWAEGCIQPVDGKYTSVRNKDWSFTPTELIDDVRKAFALFNVPSTQEQLEKIIALAENWADKLTNLPLLMQGITGATPDTLGGMELLEANAASPLMNKVKEYDEVVGPMISDAYDWAMQDPNVSNDAKGDFKCVALGASVLIHRDRKAVALQQVAAPMSLNPAYGLSPERTAEQTLRAVEIDPNELKLTEAEKQQQAQQQGQQQDPRVQAATIKAQSDAAKEQSRRESEEQERQFKADQAERDRVLQKVLADIEIQVKTLEMADDRNLNLEQIRASLAETAMTLRSKHSLFLAERQFAVTDGHGRGL